MCRSRRSSRTSSMRIWSPRGSTMYRSGCTPLFTRETSPISSAANATAAARLPTPGGPWKRYACAVPSASAARRRRFASACSGNVSKTSTDLLGDLLGRAVALDGGDALRKHLGERTVRVVDRPMELFALALDPVGGGAALQGEARIDQDEEGAVGQEAAGGGEVELEHEVDAEVSRNS